MPSSRSIERNGRLGEHRRRSNSTHIRSDASGSDLEVSVMENVIESNSKSKHSKHGKNKSSGNKRSKRKRHSRDGSGVPDNSVLSVASSVVKPLVEYSDVSSEALSGPEAGEIQSDDSARVSLSEGEVTPPSGKSRHQHKHGRTSSKALDSTKSFRHHSHSDESPPRKISSPHSPSPSIINTKGSGKRRDHQHSLSPISEKDDLRHMKHRVHSPPLDKHSGGVRDISPSSALQVYRKMKGDIQSSSNRHRSSSSSRKKEKKHKRDRGERKRSNRRSSRSPNSSSGRKKRKKKYHSRSSSPEPFRHDSISSPSLRRDRSFTGSGDDDLQRRSAMQWNRIPSHEMENAGPTSPSNNLKNNLCTPDSPPFIGSPVSPPRQECSDMDIDPSDCEGSPIPHLRSGRMATPPLRHGRTPVSSPHTPPLPPKAYEKLGSRLTDCENVVSGRRSPSLTDRRSHTRHTQSPVDRPTSRSNIVVIDDDEDDEIARRRDRLAWVIHGGSSPPKSSTHIRSPLHHSSRRSISPTHHKRKKTSRGERERVRSRRREKERERSSHKSRVRRTRSRSPVLRWVLIFSVLTKYRNL